ncbi:MAG: ester cyclase [Steroidobacteraceae bacterium]
MSIERNKQASKRWHEAWGTDRLETAYADVLASDFRALFFGHGWVSRDKYMKGDLEFLAAFADVQLSVEEMVAEGELVMCRMRWRGRQVAPVLGVESTGRSFEVIGFAQDTFKDGRVVEHVPLFDQAALIRQLKGETADKS